MSSETVPIQALRAELENLESFVGPGGLLGQRPIDPEHEEAVRARITALKEAIQERVQK